MEIAGVDEMSTEECWTLLRNASVGRLALSARALPVILPVQYYVHDDELAICLGHHRMPDTSVHDAVVAFAADSIQPDATGWSVQVQGISSAFDPYGLTTDCGRPRGGQMIRLAPVNLAGYRVRLCPIASLQLGVEPT